MNICFYYGVQITPTAGGIERITDTIARSLTNLYGCKCYSIYRVEAPWGDASDIFVESEQVSGNHQWEIDKITELLKKWNIDVVINQASFTYSFVLAEAACRVRVKQVFCYHTQPGVEFSNITFEFISEYAKRKPSLRNYLKIPLYPIVKLWCFFICRKKYALVYKKADCVVLLSERVIPVFMDFGGIKDRSKFRFMPNALSFDDFLDYSQIDKKKPQVLIVCRMEEIQKRISLALEIWNRIEKSGEFPSWTLHLVGDGPALADYKDYVRKQKMQQVVFEGAHPPKQSYVESSIFMMTSRSEGWGLTLTEAQQMGCVPLAFDTYAALHDIITDSYNGFIIPEGDIKMYVSRLTELMRSSDLRYKMAVGAIESSHRFEQEKIAKQWMELLTSVRNS